MGDGRNIAKKKILHALFIIKGNKILNFDSIVSDNPLENNRLNRLETQTVHIDLANAPSIIVT